jgi:hypothetical protein
MASTFAPPSGAYPFAAAATNGTADWRKNQILHGLLPGAVFLIVRGCRTEQHPARQYDEEGKHCHFISVDLVGRFG